MTFRYTGHRRDGNANRGLYYLRARSYDPALGRFLQKDPLPLANRYAYAGNNPANLTDPSGLFPCPGCNRVKHGLQSVSHALSPYADKVDWTNVSIDSVGGACGLAVFGFAASGQLYLAAGAEVCALTAAYLSATKAVSDKSNCVISRTDYYVGLVTSAAGVVPGLSAASGPLTVAYDLGVSPFLDVAGDPAPGCDSSVSQKLGGTAPLNREK